MPYIPPELLGHYTYFLMDVGIINQCVTFQKSTFRKYYYLCKNIFLISELVFYRPPFPRYHLNDPDQTHATRCSRDGRRLTDLRTTGRTDRERTTTTAIRRRNGRRDGRTDRGRTTTTTTGRTTERTDRGRRRRRPDGYDGTARRQSTDDDDGTDTIF